MTKSPSNPIRVKVLNFLNAHEANRRMRVKEVAARLECSIGLVYDCLKELGVKKTKEMDINWDLPNSVLAEIWQSTQIAKLRWQRGEPSVWTVGKITRHKAKYEIVIAEERVKAKHYREGKCLDSSSRDKKPKGGAN